jgi:hypothetical protein
MYVSVSENPTPDHQKKFKGQILCLAVLKPPGTVLKP